jgi:Tfp pilus assembly protein PilO
MNKNLIAALLLGVAGLGFFAFLMPAYKTLQATRHSLDERKILLADMLSARENIRKLNDDYKSNEATIALVLLALPKQKQYDYLTESFQAAAQESGMDLASLSIAEAEKGTGDYQAIPIKAELSGSYPDFLSFLEALEHSLRLYDIIKVDITKSEDADRAGDLTILLQAQAYSLK